jgi:hypothetical protein
MRVMFTRRVPSSQGEGTEFLPWHGARIAQHYAQRYGHGSEFDNRFMHAAAPALA